ncbi:MAG: PilZ domain-containing protein [Proteobacteria bacterium]|nr:PilZ domain-containing protein [Pseudomonadota bacterium]
MNKEYRKSKRVKPSATISIVDMIIGTKLGEVLNVSADGLLVASHSKIDIGEIFQTEWHFGVRGMKNISVGLECLWSESQYTNICLCGFFIIDISPGDQDILDRLISQSQEVFD